LVYPGIGKPPLGKNGIYLEFLGHHLVYHIPLWRYVASPWPFNPGGIYTRLLMKRFGTTLVIMVIGKNKMIGYYEVVSDKPTIYQLRFAALLHELKSQTKDPAAGVINERKLIEPNEFFEYVQIKNYRSMLDEAAKWFEKIKI